MGRGSVGSGLKRGLGAGANVLSINADDRDLLREWAPSLAALACGLAALLALFWPTATSAVALWESSSAYNYAYLIAPISLYLIWIERDSLRELQATPTFAGVLVVVAFALVWLVADLVSINEGRHLAFVGMMQGLFLSVLGFKVYKRYIFALSYLWLMVPTGEFLIPSLQTFTHAGGLALLQAAHIPVFGEGILIQVPAGDFLVERACAGLNFVLASLALSLLYAKLTYVRWPKRVICVVAALTISVLANVVRVFLIIALTQWTDRKLDIAEDHLLFGWGFFGIVMMIVMWMGMSFADEAPQARAAADKPPHPRAARLAAVTAAVALVAAAAPLAAGSTAQSTNGSATVAVLPDAVGAWQRVRQPNPFWRPATMPADSEIRATYERAGATIDVAINIYRAQHDGHEAAAAGNQPADATGAAPWRVIKSQSRSITRGDAPFTATAAHVQSIARTFAVFHWYESAACDTESRLRARICSARERLAGRPSDGAYVAMATEVTGSDATEAEMSLAEFASHLPRASALVVGEGHGRE